MSRHEIGNKPFGHIHSEDIGIASWFCIIRTMKNGKAKIWAVVFVLLAILSAGFLGLKTDETIQDSRIAKDGIKFQEIPNLARNFWAGRAWIPIEQLDGRSYSDAFVWNKKIYLPFAPMAIIAYMPLVLLTEDTFPVMAFTFPLLLIAGWLIFLIAREYGMRAKNAIWVGLAYSLGSSLAPLAIPLYASWSVILLANIFLLSALWSHQTRRHPLLTGLFLSFAVMTRPISVFGILMYFLLKAIFNREKKARLPKALSIVLPVLIGLVVVGCYNQVRFGDFFETGYRMQWEYDQALTDRMTHGAFDLHYMPVNFWYMLLAPPNLIGRFPFVLPNPMGLGLLFSSPYLIYLAGIRNRKSLIPLLAAFAGMIPVLTYYATGFWQIGYRYAVDIYPLIFLALISSLAPKLPNPAKALIAISVFAHVIWIVCFTT